MLILEEQTTGLNAGLNRGLKIGKMLKKNIRLKNVSIKNAVKVGKKLVPIASMAMSIIPGGGIVSKVLDSKVGKILTKVKSSKAIKLATKLGKSKVGKFAINNVVKPTIKNVFTGNQAQPVYNEPQQVEASEPVEAMPNATPTPAQLETIAEVKGVPAESLTTGTVETGEAVPNDVQLETISKVKDIPVQNLKEEAQAQKEMAQIESGTTSTDKPNYTIPIVIGVGAVGAILLATSSKSN
ncbi:hypothetical protein FCR2A7T_23890 [Flavobacterium cauense R2A-7]|uniref:Uncharacterized protein n=1 Tax=Flavobacterium cauense R2A-7 TaxID=1341154 RepID=V6RWX0_9FLAO|nr:hypothetical protein [Flavobacterium cauense]ESU18981.1 hypothetical protein FCR2A7T_23890 [Flavobacterium cauense R2A-7]KGO82386.1 hypothetical protein Q762_06870 [Flavobacterium cauense R2A-7]TWI15360.1 hypothetical protein IP98_00352 [Flavobacterium cauense R2A-7]